MLVIEGLCICTCLIYMLWPFCGFNNHHNTLGLQEKVSTLSIENHELEINNSIYSCQSLHSANLLVLLHGLLSSFHLLNLFVCEGVTPSSRYKRRSSSGKGL